MAEHKLYDCPGNKPECMEGRCVYCEGGLTFCTVCKGAEISLPTECPGRRMSTQEEVRVSAGTLNFINGEWVGDIP